jgi:hypothetical protein
MDTPRNLVPLPSYSVLRIQVPAEEPRGFSMWIDRTVRTSPIEAIFICVGHVALGVIVGFSLLGG